MLSAELVSWLLLGCLSSAATAPYVDLSNVFRDDEGVTVTGTLDNFWHSTGFTPPSSEPRESAAFLLSRGRPFIVNFRYLMTWWAPPILHLSYTSPLLPLMYT